MLTCLFFDPDKKLKTENYIKHIGYILFQNLQTLPTLNNTCYTTITMKNIKLTHPILSTKTNTRHPKTSTQKPTITQQMKRLPKLFFFNHKKPMKTTHKPRRKLTLDQVYQKLPLCQNKLPYGNLLRKNIPMKFQDKHKVFVVKYDVRSLVHGVSTPFFMQKTLHTTHTYPPLI